MVTVTNQSLPAITPDLLLILEAYAKTPPQKNRPAPDVYYTNSAGKLALLSSAMEPSLKKLIEKYAPGGTAITPAALTLVSDTNVTITAAGTPATALLQAVELTLSWTGALGITRGGTGLTALGTANQLIRVNAGATALEYFTPSFLTTAITSINTLTTAAQTMVTGTTGTDFGIFSSGSAHTFNLPTASATNTGKLSAADWIAFNAKEPSITVLPISKGGTNSSTALSNNRVIKSSGGAIVEAAAITAAMALISDANGIPTHSAVTGTELGYVSGVTSAIQTQLTARVRNYYMDNSSHTLTGVTGETYITHFAFPLNITNAQFHIRAFLRGTAFVSGNMNIRWRVGNNLATPTAGTQIALFTLTNTNSTIMERHYVAATNYLQGVSWNTSIPTDAISGMTYNSASIDWTQQQYLFVTCNPTNSGNGFENISLLMELFT